MDALTFLLLTAGAICFGLAALSRFDRLMFIAIGLLFWILTVWLPAVQSL